MATTCNYCGYRSNEVKSGSGVSESGTRITLTLTHVSDLSRDVIKVGSMKEVTVHWFDNVSFPLLPSHGTQGFPVYACSD